MVLRNGLKTSFLAAVLLATPIFGRAQAQQDAASYCQYMQEQARAQADQLRTPSLMAGLSQPTAGTPIAAFSGLQNSIANDRKAALTISLGHAQCEVYKSTEAAQLRIEYALPTLQKEALENRLRLIREADDELAALIRDGERKLDVRDSTLPALYALQTVKSRLEADRTATGTAIAGLSTPDFLPDATPIRDLIQNKLSAEGQMEKTSNKEQAALNWDLSLDVGVRHQLNSSEYDPYGEVIFSYNLGALAVNRHLRQSEVAYQDWKRSEQNDIVQNANDLKLRLQDLVIATRTGLAALLGQRQIIEQNLKLVEGVDTSVAVTFRSQLQADDLLLRIEIGNATFSLDQLTSFLTANF